ncbi:hypothetical protein MYMA111404_03105 [Mycoplasma marinum]|uniref:Uncharacterized protein n=1 Tax=Mycoplasma marinum TaxID=1937190 RepID=A0A4R0XNV0_9MOLU|nr:hypothetical protein C4B24_02770 [Mycoplasma marinum]
MPRLKIELDVSISITNRTLNTFYLDSIIKKLKTILEFEELYSKDKILKVNNYMLVISFILIVYYSRIRNIYFIAY